MPLGVQPRVCNCCGKDMDFFDIQEDFTISRKVGYGSKYDMMIIDLRICGDCFDKIVDGCSVTPVIGAWDWS